MACSCGSPSSMFMLSYLKKKLLNTHTQAKLFKNITHLSFSIFSLFSPCFSNHQPSLFFLLIYSTFFLNLPPVRDDFFGKAPHAYSSCQNFSSLFPGWLFFPFTASACLFCISYSGFFFMLSFIKVAQRVMLYYSFTTF